MGICHNFPLLTIQTHQLKFGSTGSMQLKDFFCEYSASKHDIQSFVSRRSRVISSRKCLCTFCCTENLILKLARDLKWREEANIAWIRKFFDFLNERGNKQMEKQGEKRQTKLSLWKDRVFLDKGNFFGGTRVTFEMKIKFFWGNSIISLSTSLKTIMICKVFSLWRGCV